MVNTGWKRTIRTAGVMCLVMGLLVITVTAAFADYSITQTSNNLSWGLFPGAPFGQSFTTVDAGQISQIEFLMDGRNNYCHDWDLRIYSGDTSPNSPGSALYTESFAGLGTSGWGVMVLSSPLTVAASTQYTFEIDATGCSAGTSATLYASTTNPYAGGRAWGNGSPNSGRDLAFRIFLLDPPPPTATPVPVGGVAVGELDTIREHRSVVDDADGAGGIVWLVAGSLAAIGVAVLVGALRRS